MKRRWRLLMAGVGLLLGLAGTAQAIDASSDAAQRKQIRAERAAGEARFRQAEAECNKRFVVSSCIAEAQADRRRTVDELRLRELTLDEAKRAADAEESARRVQAKQAEAAGRPPPVARAASAPPSAAASAANGRADSDGVRARSKTADEATAAAARVAAQQRRAIEAEAHRQDVEKRNAERLARGKKSSPLPVPTAASVAAAASAPTR